MKLDKLEKQNIIKYTDFISNYFYQQIAFYLTLVLVKTKITPNSITVISLILGIFSGVLIYFNHIYLSIFFLNMSFIFDCIDGQLARAKSLHSDFGMWLDNISDRVGENSIFIAMLMKFMDDRVFIVEIVFVIFINMYYAYMSDMLIYAKRQGYKKLTLNEKILFFPLYFISRSMMIPVLTIFILFPKIMAPIIILLYIYGIVFRIYREVTK